MANTNTIYAVLAFLLAAVWFLYYRLKQWRFNTFAHIPSVLPGNTFTGHLGYLAAELKKAGNSAVDPDYAFENIWKSCGSPDYMFLDIRPAQKYPLILIASPELAEQVSRASKTQQYGVGKSPTIQEGFRQLLGRYSLLSEDGESWKRLRKTFNPGFAPQHLMSLLPVVIDKTRIFIEKLDTLAKSGIATPLEPYCTNVTFDIISEVITDIDSKAQDETINDDGIIHSFRLLGATYAGGNGMTFEWLNVFKRIIRTIYSRRLDTAIKKCITDKLAQIEAAQGTDTNGTKDRSVLALALRDTENLTPQVLQSITDQVKTFLFAGHDTTSILLQRLFYTLSIHPKCLAKIRAEHDKVFGDSDAEDVFLARPDETMKALEYTSACIKEALRLWPPASSARMAHNGFKIRTSDGDEVCLDGCVLYLCHYIIHRNPKVYGDTVDDFVPERWVSDANTGSETTDDDDASSPRASKIPTSAWRAFERGPRNCIGQELANMEARVILACAMRRYDFVKVGLGEVETDDKGKPIVDGKGKYKTKSELINTMAITSKPIDKTVMRVKFHEKVG